MQKYPNLPGVQLYLSDSGESISIDPGLPKSLVFGTIDTDFFEDGTPIQFNEPYSIPSMRAVGEMFGGTGSLFEKLSQVAMGSNTTSVPVAVRIGYPVEVDSLINVQDITLKSGGGAERVSPDDEGTLSLSTNVITLSNTPVVPGSVRLGVDGIIVYDRGDGTMSDNGEINYETGVITLFDVPTTTCELIEYYYDDTEIANYTLVEGESLTPSDNADGTWSATLSSGNLIPGTLKLTVDSTEVTDDGEGTLVGITGGTVIYDTGVITVTAESSPTMTADEYCHHIVSTGKPVPVINVEYTPSFNVELLIKVKKPNTAAGSIDGMLVDISVNGGKTFDYMDVDVSSPFLMKEVGISVGFLPGATQAIEGHEYNTRIEVRSNPADNNELYKALTDAYNIVEGVDATIVSVGGIYLDSAITNVQTAVAEGDSDYSESDPVTASELNFGYQLARFCEKTSSMNHSCVGLIGVSEPPSYNLAAIKAWSNTLKSLEFTKQGVKYGYSHGFYKTTNNRITGSVITDEANNPIDLGAYLLPVVAWGKLPTSSKVQDCSGYIGAYCYFRAGDKLVNIDVPNFTLSYSIPKSILNELVGSRFTVMNSYYRRTYNLVQAPVVRTAAMPISAFTKLSTIKVVNETAENLREVADKYLGRPNSPQVREAMKTEMESVLRAGVSIGKFQAGTVTVESTGMENILGIVKAYVKLRAFSEIHDVEIYLTYANPTQ
jgi:hypothetical protein